LKNLLINPHPLKESMAIALNLDGRWEACYRPSSRGSPANSDQPPHLRGSTLPSRIIPRPCLEIANVAVKAIMQRFREEISIDLFLRSITNARTQCVDCPSILRLSLMQQSISDVVIELRAIDVRKHTLKIREEPCKNARYSTGTGSLLWMSASSPHSFLLVVGIPSR